MSEVKFVGKRFRGCIDIPENVDVDEGIKIYNQGWGHCLKKVIGFIRNNEIWDEDELITFVNTQRKTTHIHRVIVSPKQSKNPCGYDFCIYDTGPPWMICEECPDCHTSIPNVKEDKDAV